MLDTFIKLCHGHRQYTSPHLNDAQNVAKSEDNVSDFIALPDSLSMFGCEILYYQIRVISLLIQNESIDLIDDVKRSPETLGRLLFSIFTAFEMAPKRVQLSLSVKNAIAALHKAGLKG